MKLKYLRITVFYKLLQPYSDRVRKKRMRAYTALMDIKEGMSVLDLGGQPMIWDSVPLTLDLTILNLPGIALKDVPSHHKIQYIDGDACEIREFEERTFDTVFSNSAIEHVGPRDKQEAFALQMRRLGRSYWVQTPAKWFPIEAHCGMPFWWFYPAWLRRCCIEHWRKKLPAWAHMVEESAVLMKKEMRRLFPEAKIITETSFGIPKSYIAYFNPDAASDAVRAPSETSRSDRPASSSPVPESPNLM